MFCLSIFCKKKKLKVNIKKIPKTNIFIINVIIIENVNKIISLVAN